jgi:hypothetical protein
VSLGDPGESVTQVGLWVYVVELCRLHYEERFSLASRRTLPPVQPRTAVATVS